MTSLQAKQETANHLAGEIQFQIADKLRELRLDVAKRRSGLVQRKDQYDIAESIIKLEIATNKEWLQSHATAYGLEGSQPLLSNDEARKNAIQIARAYDPILKHIQGEFRSQSQQIELDQIHIESLQQIYDLINKFGVSHLTLDTISYLEDKIGNLVKFPQSA